MLGKTCITFMSYLNKNPRQRAVMLFPNSAAAKLWYTGEIENRREQQPVQQVQQGTFDKKQTSFRTSFATDHGNAAIATTGTKENGPRKPLAHNLRSLQEATPRQNGILT